MSDTLAFTLKLIDQMSGPAKRAAAGMSAVNGAVRGADGRLRSLETGKFVKGMGAAEGSSLDLTDALMGAWGGAKYAAAALAGVAVVGIGLAAYGAHYAIEAASFKTSTITAFSLITKSSEEGRAIFDQVAKLAAKTPFSTEAVTKSVKMLLGAGFKADEAMNVFQAAGDVAAFNNFDEGVLASMTQTFAKIKSVGKLSGETLESLSVGSGGVVNKATLFAAIGKQLGKDVKGVEALMAAGKIDASTAIRGVMTTLAEGASGGKVGGLMEKLGSQIPGLLSTIKDVPFSLVPDVDSSKGLTAVKSFLTNVAAAVDGDSAVMTRAKKMVEGTIDSIMGTLFGAGGSGQGSAIENALMGVLDVLEAVGDFAAPMLPMMMTIGTVIFDGISMAKGAFVSFLPVLSAFFGGFMTGIKPVLAPLGALFAKLSGAGPGASGLSTMASVANVLGQALGTVVGVLVWVVGAVAAVGAVFTAISYAVMGAIVIITGAVMSGIGGVVSFLAGAAVGLLDAGIEMGSAIVNGLGSGLVAAWNWLVSKLSGLVDLLPGTVKKILGIASPSKVMAELGGYTAEGFAVGLDDGASDVDASMSNLIGKPGAAGAGAAGGLGGGVTIGDINVTVTADGGADAKGIAQATAETIWRVVSERFGDLAIEAGASPTPA